MLPCDRFAVRRGPSSCCIAFGFIKRISYRTPDPLATAHLPVLGPNVNVLFMHTVSRVLQVIGLTIPLLAIVAQLNERISLQQMLGFLVVAICLFSIGHLIQRYTGGGST
jgi:hypothetical protein